jgi:hypothetical protein
MPFGTVVPEPLQIDEPIVQFEFIRMPDSTGFGDYTESGQVIPVVFNAQRGGYVHAMYLNDDAPIAGGSELWGIRRSSRRRLPFEHRPEIVLHGNRIIARASQVTKALQGVPGHEPDPINASWCSTSSTCRRQRGSIYLS